MSADHVLVVRLDSAGDVLLCGPAVRAVAGRAARVTMLVGPRGAAAAELLPGVDEVVVWDCPWIAASPAPVARADIDAVVARLRDLRLDAALILTSFHQSALPTALVLRLAAVPRIAAVSDDYPGALLDVRIPAPPDAPEAMRMLSIAAAAGYPSDDGALLRVRQPLPVPDGRPEPPYVVVHPGTDAPARSYPVASWRSVVTLLTERGHTVVVTGSRDETTLGRSVASAATRPGRAIDLSGRTTLAELAAVLAGAGVVAVGNTGPAHLAAAVDTPVVSLFAPVVPAVRWAPYGVSSVVLGDQHAACAGTRARTCPLPGHPCLAGVQPSTVVAAMEQLDASAARSLALEVPA